jgi:hypothetical protein
VTAAGSAGFIKSRRGGNTYASCESIGVPAGKVKEVVFAGRVRLPVIETASGYDGNWTRLD